MLTTVTVPADNERGPLYMEQALAAVHAANAARLPLTLAYARIDGSVGLCCAFPPSLRAAIEGQLTAAYPDCALGRLARPALTMADGHAVWSVDIHLKPDVFPLRRHPQFEDALNRTVADPLSGVLTALAGTDQRQLQVVAELHLRPASRRRRRHARRVVHRLGKPLLRAHPKLCHAYAHASTSRSAFVRLCSRLLVSFARGESTSHNYAPTETSPRAHDREDDVQAAADKVGRHLFEAHLRVMVAGPESAAGQAMAALREIAGAFGQFTLPRLCTWHVGHVRHSALPPARPRGRGFLLSCQELATLWHPPAVTVRAPSMAVVESREREPPVSLPVVDRHPDVSALGRVRFRRRAETFGLRLDDRRRHTAVIGKTGMGKSTLLLNLVGSDIRAGHGVGLIDPHGDLADAVLATVPARRTNDVVLFDAGDREFPIAFNPLACAHPEDRPLVASGVLAAFKKLFGESWGPRLEHILRNTLLAVLESREPSLLTVQRVLADEVYRTRLTAQLHDPVVRAFWTDEFARWNDRYRGEAIAPVQNKLGHFLSQPLVRAIVGQQQSTVDLRSFMDGGRVLIANLSKGRVGDDASALLGALLVSAVQIAAMGRADLPAHARRDFFLYVDEFQNFATDAFPTILSEARKYGLCLTVANQYLAQMDEATLDAVFGNVGSLLVFQVGARDSEVLTEQLGGDLTPRDLLMLPRYRAYARLLIDGLPTRPFSMETLPPVEKAATSRNDIIRRTSRHRYCSPAADVERQIAAAFA